MVDYIIIFYDKDGRSVGQMGIRTGADARPVLGDCTYVKGIGISGAELLTSDGRPVEKPGHLEEDLEDDGE
jgi:hypothetical protein